MSGDTTPADHHRDRRLSPTRATIIIDGGSVTVLPKRAPVGNSGPIRGRSLTIFPTPPATESALAAALPARHLEMHLATLAPGGDSALAVRDLTQAEATAVGQSLGLAGLLYWDGRRAHVLPL
jgi:hypothetical protein